ncbi:hypothetical protein KGP17_15345 [Serratia sp. JSRIV001]|uniref:hypothetical protein n=1 Tax=Serratia sp. JSRIV001 TaxID=2831893 RepID=UPI001CBD1FEA|nr:hypothetical protein [Serratia sp. JSRIV001]UAN43860.1 hypothetical protein KGP17_15345 [Serratia sp. JSRIV001]
MQKLFDEYDIEINPEHTVTAITMYGVTEDAWGYIEQDDNDPAFFSVYRIENGLQVCVGDFSEREDAQTFAQRLCDKYGVGMQYGAGVREVKC